MKISGMYNHDEYAQRIAEGIVPKLFWETEEHTTYKQREALKKLIEPNPYKWWFLSRAGGRNET